MRYRLLAAVFAVALAANAQNLSIQQLRSFLQSAVKIKQSDKDVAGYLAHARLSEKLDDRTVEGLQSLGIGPKTLAALRGLRDQSQDLEAAPPAVPEPQPKPAPPPSEEEQGAIIAEVRGYALNYSRNLPDFICTQVTRRYLSAASGNRGGEEPSWLLQDTLTLRLSYFQQKEDYKLILVNNTLANQDYRKLAGATSTGEFGSMLAESSSRKPRRALSGPSGPLSAGGPPWHSSTMSRRIALNGSSTTSTRHTFFPPTAAPCTSIK